VSPTRPGSIGIPLGIGTGMPISAMAESSIVIGALVIRGRCASRFFFDLGESTLVSGPPGAPGIPGITGGRRGGVDCAEAAAAAATYVASIHSAPILMAADRETRDG
jgi:hypothetical protein